jgi:hypothetical protein
MVLRLRPDRQELTAATSLDRLLVLTGHIIPVVLVEPTDRITRVLRQVPMGRITRGPQQEVTRVTPLMYLTDEDLFGNSFVTEESSDEVDGKHTDPTVIVDMGSSPADAAIAGRK